MFKYILFTLFFTSTIVMQATGISISAIPDSLSENAFAVVDNYEAIFSQTDQNNATYKVSKTVTILSQQGEVYGHFFTYGDKFRELKDFSGIVKNAVGTVIRKIGKKDLKISSFSEHMATDNYSIVYECKVPAYPYTVEYTYTMRWKNGILAYPAFVPFDGYMQSVVKANYTLELPADKNLRHKSNFGVLISDEVVNNKHVYTFSANNLKAMEKEPLAPSYREICPRVLIGTSDFCYDSSCGNMEDWKSYGLWVNGLLTDRDVLPEPVISKIKDQVKDAKTEREKVEILYKYLQDNSRYVSIQLGIGGFQPIEASSVAKSGYGDCKGLSNLMKAYLNVVGIASNYCEISMKEKNLHKDFANVSQTDHAILLVPLRNDSIWLECTSQTLPFGYIHDDISGHDALVITAEGGKICRLPVYSDTDNKTISKLTLNITEDGAAKGNLTLSEYLHTYAYNVSRMTSKDRDKVVNYINKNVKFPKVQLDNINVTENKASQPSCTLTADLTVGDFVNKTGTRLFIPICPLKKGHYELFSSNKRTYDICRDYGFSESDTIIYIIPDGYTFESIPKDIDLSTPYGKLKTIIEQSEGRITYTQNIDVFSGIYSKSVYNDIKAFFGEIAAATKRRIVLKKI
ncbi:hypothetical protein M2451_000358 [Dysgonomonas sp. PFB1-18]|uniref:DUF3857 domain-containing protein n=1 Tax=unclassified Dysgonomonas TaxID=2630389 RepID=UPI002474AE9B|nr:MULTISPECIES: DUF3857 domain-containing protein [unclassified Dysgonomonas]MDH6307909.1 hypothetical protein [Dysgonomonas sp. PF1-14]MDH6337827.1 hypothetical protein [Dysgonomonas sp. PF1-16]MDH6379051.1 hypothetical protein [Dysgonomonas sp. PFB1-18]MDH6396686.1 hypothetical protein [Dysgonomonas sp. PF1-23]